MNKRVYIHGASGTNYGFRGEGTGLAIKQGWNGRCEAKGGDLIAFNSRHGENGVFSFSGIVMKDDSGRFGVMGLMATSLDLQVDNATLVLGYNKVPIEMVEALHGDGFTYNEEEIVEMSLEEIEKLVGKRVKIIKEED